MNDMAFLRLDTKIMRRWPHQEMEIKGSPKVWVFINKYVTENAMTQLNYLNVLLHTNVVFWYPI